MTRAKKSFQMGSAAAAPVCRSPSGIGWSWPTQTPAHRSGREADEPGVRVLVGRPRLSGQRPAEERRAARPSHPPLDDAAHQVGHHVGGLGRDDLLGFDPGLLEDVAVLVLDPGDEIGPETDALVGEGRVGRDHLEEGDLEGPQAERKVRIERRGDAEAAAIIDADLRRDEIEELRRDDVPGLFEPDPDGDRALVLPVVVLGRPGFVVPAVDEGHAARRR